MVSCPLAAAAVLSCRVQPDWWIAPHLAVRTFLMTAGGNVGLRSLFSALTFGLLLGCLLLGRVGVPSRLRFRGFGRLMMSACSSCLVMMLCTLMSPLMLMMFLEVGLSGLGLLRLHLLMLFGSVVVPFLLGVCFLAGVALCFALYGLAVIRFGRLATMLLMLLMLLTFSCIVILPSLLCLI